MITFRLTKGSTVFHCTLLFCNVLCIVAVEGKAVLQTSTPVQVKYYVCCQCFKSSFTTQKSSINCLNKGQEGIFVGITSTVPALHK